MGTIRVLLCCGAGFSSGFLAQKARQAAKKKKLDMTVEARSESVVSEYMDKMDVLLVGPPLCKRCSEADRGVRTPWNPGRADPGRDLFFSGRSRTG